MPAAAGGGPAPALHRLGRRSQPMQGRMRLPPGGGAAGVCPAPGPRGSAGTLSPVTASEASGFGLWLPGLPGPDGFGGSSAPSAVRQGPRGYWRGRPPWDFSFSFCLLACSAGVLFPRRKSTQKGASPLRAGPPPFCPIGRYQMGRCAATESENPPGIRSVPGFSTMLRPLALLKGYANLVVLCQTACGCGHCFGSRQQRSAKSFGPKGPAERKAETALSPRAVRRSA